MNAKEKPSSKGRVSLLLGFVVALLAMGLPMIGITVNLYLGVFILLLAFILLAYGIWCSETGSWWNDSARVSTLWILGIIYFGLVGFQIYNQHLKDHPILRSPRYLVATSVPSP
jgi:hypothetical protein